MATQLGNNGITMSAGLGTSPPAVVPAADNNDLRGSFTFGSGASPTTGALLRLNFTSGMSLSDFAIGSLPVTLKENNAATVALGLYVSQVTAQYAAISCTTAPAASQPNTTYSLSYTAAP